MQKKQKHLLECCEYWEQGTCLIHDTLMGQKNAFTGGCDGVTSADPTEKNMFDPNLNDCIKVHAKNLIIRIHLHNAQRQGQFFL